MKTTRSFVVIGIALAIATGVMLNVRPRKHVAIKTEPLLSRVALETQSAEAANPCSMATITASAGCFDTLNGGGMAPNQEYVYQDGDSFTTSYDAGCAPAYGFNVAVLRCYIWMHPTNQTGYWTNDGRMNITLGGGCESMSCILHTSHLGDCSMAFCDYTVVGNPYCPCK